MNFGIKTNFEATEGLEKLETKEPQNNEPTIKEPIKKEEPPSPPINEEPIFEPLKTKEPEPPIKEEVELTPEQILGYLNKDRETPFETLEDVYKTKEVEKEVINEVNPWEDVMDAEDEAYYKFKRETNGRGRKEFDFIQQDLSKLSPLEMAISRIKQDSGIPLSNSDAKSYLEQELNIDLAGDDISVNDKIKLNTYAKPYRESQEALKEKYTIPLEKKNPTQPGNNVEMVELENGDTMPKAMYDQHIKKHNEYIDNIKKASNSVVASDFSIEIDNNGEKRKLDFSYEYSNDDRHSMVSDASDIDATVSKNYRTKEGFNHAGLQEGMWWMNQGNRQKVISAAMEKARADAIEEVLADSNNENFTRQKIVKTKTADDGYGNLPEGDQAKQNFGVKYGGL